MATVPVDTLFDRDLMTADMYNNIREFSSEIPFGAETVEKFGSIIHRHSLEKQLGILYVHRHFDMPPDSIAMEETRSNDIRVIGMPPLAAVEPSEAHGISFKLMETGKFQAFEYSARSVTPTFPHAFLEELAQFITENNLAEVLGISVRSGEDELPTCELNLFKPKISVTLPTKEIPADLRENATPTYWGSEPTLKAIIDEAFQKRGLVF